MRFTKISIVAIALSAAAPRGAAGEPASSTATASPTPTPTPTSTPTPLPACPECPGTDGGAKPSETPAWHHAYEWTAGLGYYERFNVGVAFRPSPASSLGLFGGTNFGARDSSTWTVGAAWSHAFRQPAGGLEMGLDAKAMYWAQSNPDYDWKMMTLVFGAYLAREVRRDVTLVLDAGASLNFSLDATRKQNVNFAYPTRWNGSFCLQVRYRFDEW